MTAGIPVLADERGTVRVFALSMTDKEAKALKERPGAIAQTLGCDAPLDTAHLDLFPVRDLDEVGLVNYLADGAGIPEAQLIPDRSKLDQLDGWVLVVYAYAFGGRAITLFPRAALTLIGTYAAARTDWTTNAPLQAHSAEPFSGAPSAKRPSDAALSGRVALIVLIGLGLFTYIFIRIAG